jgi:hypothetical protein
MNAFWQNQSFHNYADYTLTPPFHSGLARLRALGQERRCAIMCAEAVWWRCPHPAHHLKSSRHEPEDRAYLVRLTAAYTGLAQPDAERRVDEAAARAKENIARARRSAVILAFMAGAAALLGAAAA